jgi:phosphatidylglycerophosphate synthase
MKRIPNILSLLRILIGVAAVSGLMPKGWFVTVFCCAAASDFLDGFLARRFGWSSAMGAGIDIFADGVFFLGAYLALWFIGLLPGIWLLLIVLFALPEVVCQAILCARGSGMGSLGLVINKALGGFCYLFTIAVALGANVVLLACIHLFLELMSNGADLYFVVRRRERLL